MAISIREVTDVDRRTAARLGMKPEMVNSVINTWAEEYLTMETQQSRLAAAANPAPAPARPARAPRKAATRASGPKAPKAAAKETQEPQEGKGNDDAGQ